MRAGPPSKGRPSIGPAPSSRPLVARQLVVAGDLVDSRHIPWAGDTKEVVTRITEHWGASGFAAHTDASVWLELTAAGFSRGEEVLARDGLPASIRWYDGHWGRAA